MTVPKSKRHKSRFEVFHNMQALQKELITTVKSSSLFAGMVATWTIATLSVMTSNFFMKCLIRSRKLPAN